MKMSARGRCTDRCGSTAEKIQIGILSKQIRFGLRCIEAFAAHYEMTAEIVTLRKKE